MITSEQLNAIQSVAGNAKVSVATESEQNNLNRSLSGGSMSFSRTGKTTFTDSTMLKVETIINGEKRTYGAFAAKDEKGKDLLISANSIIRRLYTEDGDATHEIFQVTGISEYGDNPKEIVTNLIAKKKALNCEGVKPLFAPRFVNGQAVYEGMVRRNFPTFKVVDA